MQLRKQAEGLVRKPPVPNSPTLTVFFGGDDGSPDLGLVRVQVPAGAGMPPHRHNGSDVILAPVTGWVRISKDEESIDVYTGDCALIRKDEEVSMTNPGEQTADVIVAAGPAHFVANIRQWPAAGTDAP